MTSYVTHVQKLKTPQSESARADQKPNNAGGFAFALDDWKRLDRFLILGSDGGTFYVDERKLTRENAAVVERCLVADPKRAVARIVEVSEAGRAPKNDEAIFCLALAAASTSDAARTEAYAALGRVCRTGTHLFDFVRSVDQLRGWGRGLRRAVSRWYTEKTPDDVAYQGAKYQQRNGWSHRDVLRKAHVREAIETHGAVFRWMTDGLPGFGKEKRGAPPSGLGLPRIIVGMEQTRSAKDARAVAKLITEYGLTHEMVPNEHKHSPEVWAALLEHMPLGAMVRQLGKLSAVGLVAPLSDATKLVVWRLGDGERLKRSRLHPIALLSALRTYQSGHGFRGGLSWEVVPAVSQALETAFYAAFGNVQPTGKNTLLALDVSGSMEGGLIAGVAGLTPRVASAAMAMVTSRVEENCHAVGFTSVSGRGGGLWGGGSTALTNIDLTKRKSLDDVIRVVSGLPFGGTDCALPMTWAIENKLNGIDMFVIYTDNETWAGGVHPFQALREYRQKSGRAAKLVVVGMTASEFTIADPSDAGMLDVVGFDAAAPAVMSAFARGEL